MPPQTTPFNTHFESPPIVSGYRLWPEGKGAWGLVVPEATVNLIAQPSMESGVSSYTNVNASSAASTDYATRGLKSLKVTPSGSASVAEVYYATGSGHITNGQIYTASLDLRGTAGFTYALVATDGAGSPDYGEVRFTATGDWQRVSLTFQPLAGATLRVRLRQINLSTKVFYTDCWQLEQKAYATTYCDGDQPGCIWLGTSGGSFSQRAATAPGGRIYKFNDLGFQILNYVGAGMAQIVHSTTRRALLGGERYQRTTPQKTLITLNGEIQGYNQRQLEEVREALIALVAPNQSTQQSKALALRFQLLDACGNPQGTELDIYPAYYVGGLEGNVNNHYRERIALQFILPSTPAVKEVNQGAAALVYDISDTYGATAKKSLVKNVSNGAYSLLLDTGSAQAWVNSVDGLVYFVDDSTGSVRISTKSVSGAFSASILNTIGGFAGTILALTLVADNSSGVLYVGGNYTAATGNYLLRYTGGTFVNSGTFSAAVRAICVDNFNTVYVTGDFVTITGNSRVRIAKGSGTTWNNLVSATGLSATGRALVKGQDGNIYIGGDFLTANGVTVNRIVRYNVASDTYTALPASGTIGMNGVVRALACGPDGKIYAGGDFTTSGGVTCNRIAAWNGTQWQPLGVGLNGAVYSLSFDNQGNLYAAGQFTGTSDGTQTFPGKAAIWNGSTWHGLDYAGGSNPNFDSIWVDKILGDVYFGAQVAGYTVADRPGLTDVVYNGSAGSNPKIVLTAPGVSYTLWQISNITTGKNIYFNNYQVYNGETITLTLEPGNFSIISSTKGDISWAILPGSDISSFTLEPGTNRIEVFAIEPTAAATVTAYWDNKHWSIDAGAY